MQLIFKISMYLINTAKTFRFAASQSIFFILDNLQLYQYHKTIYTGILSSIFETLNFIQNKKWSVLSLDFILDWTSRPYYNELYEEYTNSRYLQVEKKDFLAFQTTKAYYTIFIPYVTLLFLFLNQLFYWLFQYQISQFLRAYSLWLQFLVLAFFSNSQQLTFYCAAYLQLLFSLSPAVKFSHAISLTIIGLFMILMLSFFFMAEYLYKKLSKYLLINMYRVKFFLVYHFLRFSLRTFIDVGINIFLFENAKVQLAALSAVELIFIIFSIVVELKYSIFKCKMLWSSQVGLGFCANFLNILLIFKHFVFGQDQKILEVIENCIQAIAYTMGGLIAIGYLMAAYVSILKTYENQSTKFSKLVDQQRDIILSNKTIQKCSNIVKKKIRKASIESGREKNTRNYNFEAISKTVIRVNYSERLGNKFKRAKGICV